MLKRVGTSLYTHISNISELLSKLSADEQQRVVYTTSNADHKFAIIKYNKQSKNLSLIECDTWDMLNEPIVGDAHTYKLNGDYKVIKGGVNVYHSKELFVADDYKGFDLEQAKQRTIEWNNIPNIKSIKNKIGNLKFWTQLLKENGVAL